MNIGARKAVLIPALIALLVGGYITAPAQAEDRAQIDSLFEQAKDLWERDRPAEAAKILKQLLAQDPSQETAYDLLRKAEYQMFLDLLKEGGDSALVARRLLDLGYREEQEKTKDEEAIRALVDQAIGGEDYGVRQKAVRTLIAAHGEYSVAALHGYLGSNDTDERVNAILALSQLGSAAVLPLTEALQSDNFRIQQNAALVLQKIGDVRAMGGLASLAMHAANPAVKDAAAQAMLGIVDKNPCGCSCKAGGPCGGCKMSMGKMTPAQAHMWLAWQYYKRDAKVIRNYLDGYTIWSWKDGKLVDRQVPKFLYHLRLAEEAAYDAIAEEPESLAARSMLAGMYYAEYGAVQAPSAEAKESEEGKALSDNFWNALAITKAQGVETQLGALELGLEWGDANICIGALNALASVWDGREITEESPLVKALDSGDKTVRFAAALTALKVDPGKPFPGSEKVIALAAQAAATGSVRQVLLVEPNAEIRAKALRALETGGAYAVAEPTSMRGFRRAKDVGTFDVIVIRADLENSLALTMVKELGEDFRTASTPILITGMGEELEAAKELFGTNVAGFLEADPFDVEKVMMAASGSMTDDQARALVVSKAACGALKNIVTVHTAFENYAEAEVALMGVVKSDKPDDIRLEALAALTVIGSAESVGTLTEAFSATANAVPVRVAAAGALGKILAGKAAPDKVFDALLAGMGDESRDVRAAVGKALGEMALTPAQQSQVLTQYRVQ